MLNRTDPFFSEGFIRQRNVYFGVADVAKSGGAVEFLPAFSRVLGEIISKHRSRGGELPLIARGTV